MRAGPDEVLGEPRAFLADFGLAKSVTTGSKLTRTGQALGTPAYMSPEQVQGDVAGLTPATDVWGLGCVLHETLAGRRAFDASSTAELVRVVLFGTPPAIRTLRPDVPRPLQAIVAACLARSPAGRYPEAGVLRDDLDRLLRGEPLRRRARGPRGRLLAAGALLGGAALAALAWAGPARPGARADPAEPGDPAVSIPTRGPTRAEVLAGRASALRTSEPREAARLFGEALLEEPRRHDWRLSRGVLLWSLEGAPAACAEWERIGADAPQARLATLYRGLASLFHLDHPSDGGLLSTLATGNDREARLARGALAGLRRDSPRVRAELAGLPGWEAALLRAWAEGLDPRGDGAAALRDYDQALREGIPFSWAYYNRGSLRSDLGDLAGAIADFDAALATRPGHAPTLVNRGMARRDSGDLPGALRDFDEAIRLAPDLPQAWSGRGLVRHLQGDAAGAIEDFDVSLRLRPDHALVLNNRGLARHDLGDLRGALSDYDAALRARPDHPESLNNRGRVRRALRDPRGAAEDFEAALRARPGFPEALANLGRARRDLRDWEGAAAAFRDALRAAPEHRNAPEYRRLLADCEARAGAPAGAR